MLTTTANPLTFKNPIDVQNAFNYVNFKDVNFTIVNYM